MGQVPVNNIDVQKIQPVAKFAELVDELLSEDVDAYSHLYATFYIEMPAELEYEFRQYPYINFFRFTARLDKFMSQSIMSGSFADWMGFLKWGSRRESSKFLRAYTNTMYRALCHHTFFQQLHLQEHSDRTFSLE